MKPFFSIITVTKDTGHKINNTIRSIFNQSCRDFEYIFWDGNSSDNTYKIISNYKSKKIKLYKGNDINFYDGLNKAINFSKGKYVCILNSGDIYHDKFILEKVKSFINLTNCKDAYYGNLKYFNSKNKIVRVWKKKIENNLLSDTFRIPHPSIFLSSSCIKSKKLIYDINYQISSDTDYVIKLKKNKITFVYVNYFIIKMEIGGMSTDIKFLIKKIREDLTICKKYFGKLYFFFYLKKIFLKLNTFKINYFL